jgi:hypothetical protein
MESMTASQDYAEQQRALYGAPLGERFGVVLREYGISQRTLAATLGLSAPMLSQLANAQRIKIGNPAVYARLVMLEERIQEEDKAAVLAEVRDSDPVLTTQVRPTSSGNHDDGTAPGHDRLASALAALGSPAELAAAAEAAGGGLLTAVLRRAGELAGELAGERR